MKTKQNTNYSAFLFLLYVSVMLIITFLQQEFVLLPELHNFDIVEEDLKVQILESYQTWRWLAFLSSPVLLLFRIFLVASCFFIGSFFSPEMSGREFNEWWSVTIKAQSILLIYSVLLCAINVFMGANQSMEVTKYTSLLFLGPDNMEHWLKIPLAAINVFEIAYWCVMSLCVGKLVGTSFGKSFKFVMSSYGVGYLFYIALLMFLMLYLA